MTEEPNLEDIEARWLAYRAEVVAQGDAAAQARSLAVVTANARAMAAKEAAAELGARAARLEKEVHAAQRRTQKLRERLSWVQGNQRRDQQDLNEVERLLAAGDVAGALVHLAARRDRIVQERRARAIAESETHARREALAAVRQILGASKRTETA